MMSRFDHLRRMLRIRRFEEALLQRFRDGELRGTAHVCLGQEAVASGACAALRAGDQVTSNHRGHGHMLAQGADSRRVMAELFGRRDGYALGRGGSQHMAAPDVGFLGSNGITAGGLPVAVGAALTMQQKKRDAVVLCFFGDGATAQGTFHESMNLAALWKLPVVFLCENNHYAMGTHVRLTCPTERVAQRADGYGMPRCTVDGNDPLAVEEAVRAARAHACAGQGPYFVEAVTWRSAGHSRSDACGYRDDEEEAQWTSRDPIATAREALLTDGEADAQTLDALEKEVQAEIEGALAFARASEPLPEAEVASHLYAEPSQTFSPTPFTETRSDATYADAIYEALAAALGDPAVVLLGEDIADYEGAFKVTRDLARRFGADRVRNTPISENTIVGCGVGAALTGLRPVVEVMFMDFLLLALDQLANHAAKFGYLFGGQAAVPLTVRTPAGGRRGYGATHSQCFESMLLSIPGLKVFCPATVQDAYDLTLAAIADDGPVAVVEHKLLYGTKGLLDPSATSLAPGKARVTRAGTDLTIVTFSQMLSVALEAAAYLQDEHGVSAEVIDLRTLNPLDRETIAESASRTQHVLIAEEGHRTGGVGAELAATLQEICFGYLDAPVLRVAARDCPIPAVEHLERLVLPQASDVAQAALHLLE